MKLVPLLFFVLGGAVFLSACGSESKPPVINEKALFDSVAKNAQVATVQEEDVVELIKLNGKIEPDEAKEARVYSLVSGKIEKAAVELGDFVQKGQVLAQLQSVEVAGITNDLSLAGSNVEMAKKAMETQKELYDGNLATERDYLNAKIEYNKALSELNRAKSVSAISGGSSASYQLKAPITGYIIEKNVTNNSEVRQDNSNNLFTVADLSTVWIIANVYESDIAGIHLGDPVIVNTLVNPDKEYPGKIDKVYNVLDPATRTMRVRISMNNPNGELKPEMFARVRVRGQVTGRMLAIPSQAIVLDNSKRYVVIRSGDSLSIKPVELVKRIDNKAFVRGLNAGEQVVTSNQVFLFEALNDR
ncbi:MAG: efflux RND transporter periplasmic adaptor subunit [Chitinophagaceae bacterium]